MKLRIQTSVSSSPSPVNTLFMNLASCPGSNRAEHALYAGMYAPFISFGFAHPVVQIRSRAATD